MTTITDPVELADVLLSKTNIILNRMEEEWRQIIKEPSSNKSKSNNLEEIRKELGSYRKLSGRSLGNEEKSNFGLLSDGTLDVDVETAEVNVLDEKDLPGHETEDSQKRRSTASTARVSSEKPVEKSLDIGPKKAKSSWRTELNNKISKLEEELEELRLLHSQEGKKFVANDGNRLQDNLILLDVVSSETSSPVKANNLGKTFRKNSVSVGNLKLSPKRSDCSVDLKEKLIETDRIMERGLKTAQELNKKLELYKKKTKHKKDVALQVMVPEKEVINSDNELLICGLAEDVTSLLIQQQSDIELNSKLATRLNTRHLVMQSKNDKQPEPINCRLGIQRLPDDNIRGSLTLQPLPSIHITPTSTPQVVGNENTKMYVITHNTVKEISDRGSTDTSMSNEFRTKNSQEKTKVCGRAEIGVQAHMSKNSRREESIENRVEYLCQKYEKHKEFPTDFDDAETLKILLKKVQESREMCQKYKRSNNSILLNSPEESSVTTSKVNSDPSVVSEEKITLHSKAIGSIENELYTSDFEVESLDLDESQVSSNLSHMHRESIKKEESFNKGRFEVRVVPETGPSSKHMRTSLLKSPQIESTTSKDESLIELQMKRLGLSPERQGTSWRTSGKINGSLRKSPPSRSYNTIKNEKKSKSNDKNHQTLYIKSDGKYIPVTPLEPPNVQFIVPEIVVKLPDSLNLPIHQHECATSQASRLGITQRENRRDQVIQTDEGCGTLTSGETSSVVEKLNHHFERTQQLLERIEGRPADLYTNHNGLFDLLHKRGIGSDSELSIRGSPISWRSLGGAKSRPTVSYKKKKDEDNSHSMSFPSKSEGEVFPGEVATGSPNQSIGEILGFEYR